MKHHHRNHGARALLAALAAGALALLAGCSANSTGQTITSVNGGAAAALSASPSAFIQVANGFGSTTLAWNHPKASSCSSLTGNFVPGTFNSSGTVFTSNSGANPTPVSGLPTNPGVSGSFSLTGNNALSTSTVGQYTFTLTCSDKTDVSTVNVYAMSNSTTVPLSASPGSFLQNTGPQSVNLNWSHPAVSSCTSLTGKFTPGSFGSSGTFTSSGSSTSVYSSNTVAASGPATASGLSTSATGQYEFDLTCPDSTVPDVAYVNVYVQTTDVPFTASPLTLIQNSAGTVRLVWSHPSATSSCTLQSQSSGGANQSSTVPTSGNQSVTVDTQMVGTTYTYTLTCPGYSGSPETQTVSVVAASASDQPFTATPSTIAVNNPVTLTWSHPSASSCTASETDPSNAAVTDFNGAVGVTPSSTATKKSPYTTANLTSVGTYTFKLACTYPSGTQTETQTVTVTNLTTGAACNLATTNPTTLLTNASGTPYSVTPASNSAAQLTSGLCIGCSVTDPGNVIDNDLTNFANINASLGLLGGTVSLRVATNTAFAKNTSPGFVVQFPQQALAAGALQTVTVRTLLRDSNNNEVYTGDVADATGSTGGAVKLQLLGLIGGGNSTFVGFPITTPLSSNYDAVQIDIGGLANVANTLTVYYGCVVQQ